MKDRNGVEHKSGVDNPNFALDNPFAISTSDGHDEDWTYYSEECVAKDAFEKMKANENDIHLYKYHMDFGYEVIDSWNLEGRRCVVTDIKYDTDGEEVDLPKQLVIDIPDDLDEDEIDDLVSNTISNVTGYCHFGFSTSMDKDLDIK